MSAFLHKLIFTRDKSGKRIIGGSVPDHRLIDAIKSLTYEINSIGVNLNQITHIAHLVGVTQQTLAHVDRARADILAKFAELERQLNR